MTYACEKCIHRYPLGGCLVPSNLGYVEQCKHLTEEQKPQEQTNEEWLRTLPVEERVKEVLFRGFMTEKRTAEEFVKWLKETHNGNM